jgi:biopolymer transport protein TolQ
MTAMAPVGRKGFWQMLMEVGWVEWAVLLLLAGISVVCWGIIAERWVTFRKADQQTHAFHDKFRTGASLAELRDFVEPFQYSPVVALFKAAFREISQLRVRRDEGASGSVPTRGLDEAAVADVQRMLERTGESEIRELERTITFLATTASAAPFIGLFGTVWGIMMSFLDIYNEYQGTGVPRLSEYASGIAAALVATAAGLGAAIPAVIGYNSFLRRIRVMRSEMDEFAYDFIHLLEKKRR